MLESLLEILNLLSLNHLLKLRHKQKKADNLGIYLAIEEVILHKVAVLYKLRFEEGERQEAFILISILNYLEKNKLFGPRIPSQNSTLLLALLKTINRSGDRVRQLIKYRRLNLANVCQTAQMLNNSSYSAEQFFLALENLLTYLPLEVLTDIVNDQPKFLARRAFIEGLATYVRNKKFCAIIKDEWDLLSIDLEEIPDWLLDDPGFVNNLFENRCLHETGAQKVRSFLHSLSSDLAFLNNFPTLLTKEKFINFLRKMITIKLENIHKQASVDRMRVVPHEFIIHSQHYFDRLDEYNLWDLPSTSCSPEEHVAFVIAFVIKLSKFRHILNANPTFVEGLFSFASRNKFSLSDLLSSMDKIQIIPPRFLSNPGVMDSLLDLTWAVPSDFLKEFLDGLEKAPNVLNKSELVIFLAKVAKCRPVGAKEFMIMLNQMPDILEEFHGYITKKNFSDRMKNLCGLVESIGFNLALDTLRRMQNNSSTTDFNVTFWQSRNPALFSRVLEDIPKMRNARH